MKAFSLSILLFFLFCYSSYSQGTWEYVSSPGLNVCISSATTGYYFNNEKVGSHGSKYTVYKSINGMQDFSVVKTKTGDMGCYSLDNMFFVNDNEGIIVEICQGVATLIKTNDGGQSWTDMGAGGSYDVAMYFRSSDLGYYSFYPGSPNDSYLNYYHNGSSQLIMQTTDYIFSNNDGYITRMFFVDDSTGFIICKNFMQNAIILKIENYGANWEQSYFLPMKTEFRDLLFIDENTGFVVGTNGIILKTEDQGDSWFNTATLPAGNLNSIDYSEGTLHVVGDNGQYIKSDDEGLTWTSHPLSGTPYNLVYTRFFGGDHGYILNESGELYTNFPFPGIVERNSVGDFTVFPSPADNTITIESATLKDNFKIDVFDLTGKLVLHDKNKKTLDVSSLNEGIYFVTVSFSGSISVQKFVKK